MATLFDEGSELLAPVPVALMVGLAKVEGKERLCLTIRSATTTLTVLLNKADAELWARQIAGQAKAMSGTGLIVAGVNGKPAS